MTPAEFKAWFEGFCEGIGEKPNADQWKRIQEQVKKIAAPVTVDRAIPTKAAPNFPAYPWPGERWAVGVPPRLTAGTFVAVPSNPNISTMC